jgi:hypothetical protein
VFGLSLPVVLIGFLLALRYGRLGRFWERVRISLAFRGKRADAVRVMMASRLYQEMVQLMRRHGYTRADTQTAFEFAEAVKKPGLDASVKEFARLYAEARFGGTTGDIPRLQQLLGTIRTELRARYNLIATAQNVRAFRHEMHAAKNDVFRVCFGRLLGKLQRIASKIGKLHHLVALIVVAKNHHIFSELGFGRGDAFVQRVVRHKQVIIEIAANAFFDFGRPQCFRLLNANECGAACNRGDFAHGPW